MSGYLWKYFLEDDVENFRRVLETAGYSTRGAASNQKGARGGQQEIGLGIGSPGSFGTSPTLVVKKGKNAVGAEEQDRGLTLTRSDLNHRDGAGRTLLHLASSSSAGSGYDFAAALLEHPLTDIYMQDLENGWTALHRAFYAGNVAIAHAIITRDLQDASGHGASGTLHHLAGGLIKIKDREGNGPFDLFEMALEGEMSEAAHMRHGHGGAASDSDEDIMPGNDDGKARSSLIPFVNLEGDEMFSFGSNQNLTLGFGDEDDRHHPERITLRRPDHLYFQAYKDYINSLAVAHTTDLTSSAWKNTTFVSDLPSVIRHKPIKIQDVQMAKLHSVVLTDDPESNLHVCGHGQGGRLGLGDERTRFQFSCVDSGALANKKIASVALGQNHTIALSDQGEVFTWGSNDCGQLGYDLPKTSREEDNIQTSPKRIFGPLKRETVIGVTASRVHSVAYTGAALYTWGRNDGQLGIVHSESRSTKIQYSPRNVAASRFSAPIASVSAIDRATTVLLENHEVVVFAHHIYINLAFPLHGFDNYFLKNSFMATQYDATPNRICKIASGGDTICAMSTSGKVYTVTVSEPPMLENTEMSTTNPRLGSRNALSTPVRVWSNKKTHLAARDVDVDQNGSIILVTQAGSVWKRVKRAKIKDATAAGVGENKPKDYKYSRIPGLTRVTSVRASGYGAYGAIREDCHKMREEMTVSQSTLLSDLWPLVPFQTLYPSDDHSPSFPKRDLVDMVMKSDDPDEDIKSALQQRDAPVLPYDLLLCSTSSDIEIPVHQFIVSARSKIIRTALEELGLFEQFTVPDTLTVKKGDDGRVRITFQAADILTLFNFALYAYTDSLAPVWNVRSAKKMAFRYRQTRLELQKIAAKLEMGYLESVLKRIVLPATTLHQDLEVAFADSSFFENADVVVDLANGEEMWVHGALVCQRCPFFDGLFRGRTGGQWLAERKQKLEHPDDAVRVDLSNISATVFQRVLRHIYAGTGPEIFDDVVADGLDEFLDQVLDVLAAANELMLDRLSEVCQHVVGRYINTRNVVSLLNAVAPCSVTTFKQKALEYMCYNLEAVLQHGHLEELDEDLFVELDETAHGLMEKCSIIARTGQQEQHILEKYPDLEKRMLQERQAKIDSIVLFNKYVDVDPKAPASFKAGSFHDFSESSKPSTARRRSSHLLQPMSPSPGSTTPTLKGRQSTADLMFEMEDDEDGRDATLSSFKDKLAAVTASPDVRSSSSQDELRSREAPLPSSPPLQHQPTTKSSVAPGRPWGAAPLASAKLGIKEIMDQAATPRTSTLSSALMGSSVGSSPSSSRGPSFGGKVSQKERKKMQQQGAKSDTVVPKPLSASPAPTNPWQTVGAAAKAGRSASVVETQASSAGSRTPQLTMRQTVANSTPTLKEKEISPFSAKMAPAASQGVIPSPRGPTTPQAQPSNRPRSAKSSKAPAAVDPNAPGFAISDRPVAVQSVRHVPQRDRNVSADQKAIIDILSEQEIAKQEIRDFGAKRSLQEIQAEQEFQEWWDMESRRVQGVSQGGAEKKGEGRKRGGRSRRGGRGGRGGGSGAGATGEEGATKKIGRRRGGGGANRGGGPSNSANTA